MSYRNKKVLFYDKGLYLYTAQKLGEYYDKVYYYMPDSSPYPCSNLADIGTGLPEVERVHNFWEYIDKVDMIVFPDVHDGNLQSWLRSKGYTVFGSGKSEELELDKIKFFDALEEAKLPIANTIVVTGTDELVEYLKGKTDRYIKTPTYRGDFETYHYTSMSHFEPWLDDLKYRLGSRCQKIDFIVQSPIKSACEAGYDGFCVDGKFTTNCLCGYEVKDQAYVCKVFDATPKIIDDVNIAMASHLKDCRGHYSTEIRINDKGRGYFIDPSVRIPSPPGELMCEIYSNYAESFYDIAIGKLPELSTTKLYGAEFILTSDWNDKHELCVEYPSDLSQWVKLKNHVKRGKNTYCIPNGNGGFFGAVVGLGTSLKSAIQNVVDVAEQVKAEGFKFDSSVFDEANNAVKAGEQFGIKY